MTFEQFKQFIDKAGITVTIPSMVEEERNKFNNFT